jgi:hypothetical protein
MKYRATLTIELETAPDAFDPFTAASAGMGQICHRVQSPSGYDRVPGITVTRVRIGSLIAYDDPQPLVVDPSRSTPNL